MFLADMISFSRDFALHFNFPCSARATFDRDFDFFADAYILVMSWMVYTRARQKTLSSLLNTESKPTQSVHLSGGIKNT